MCLSLYVFPYQTPVTRHVSLPVKSAPAPTVPQVIVVSQPPAARHQRWDVRPGYQAKPSMQIGIVLLVIAPLSMAFGIAGIVVQGHRYSSPPDYCDFSNWASYVGTGIWCGFWVGG